MLRCRAAALLPLICLAVATAACDREPQRVLRVCADPNNLPFTNERQEGFENRIAEVIADELDARVEYTWWAQRRGFVRNTLRAGACDVILGVPASFELALATRPYYRSTYVFVTHADRQLAVKSFDDDVLRSVRVGVQLIGDDYTNAPPAHALANRGIIDNVVGYSVLGDYAEENPPARIMDAVRDGAVDVAVVWGPLAGWYVRSTGAPLVLTPVSPQIDVPFLPFVFDMAMGVRREDVGLQEELNGALARRAADIDRILEEYGIPIVRGGAAAGRRS